MTFHAWPRVGQSIEHRRVRDGDRDEAWSSMMKLLRWSSCIDDGGDALDVDDNNEEAADLALTCRLRLSTPLDLALLNSPLYCH